MKGEIMKYKYKYLELFLTFFKIGLFTFGGGYVMIPFIEKEMVIRKKWIIQSDITDIIAITQSIPGALSINMSALVGYKIAKVRGAIISVFAVILPSFIIIVLIAMFFSQFQDLKIVQDAFLGIRSIVVVLILVAAIKISKSAIIDINTAIITIITVAFLLFTELEPIYVIAGGILFGVIAYFLSPNLTRKVVERGEKQK